MERILHAADRPVGAPAMSPGAPDALTPSGATPDSPTSIHVHRAISGDLDSLAWLIRRFSPVLLSQAQYRLGAALRRFYDPEDVVADVWSVVLRRVNDLRANTEAGTPTLIR